MTAVNARLSAPAGATIARDAAAKGASRELQQAMKTVEKAVEALPQIELSSSFEAMTRGFAQNPAPATADLKPVMAQAEKMLETASQQLAQGEAGDSQPLDQQREALIQTANQQMEQANQKVSADIRADLSNAPVIQVFGGTVQVSQSQGRPARISTTGAVTPQQQAAGPAPAAMEQRLSQMESRVSRMEADLARMRYQAGVSSIAVGEPSPATPKAESQSADSGEKPAKAPATIAVGEPNPATPQADQKATVADKSEGGKDADGKGAAGSAEKDASVEKAEKSADKNAADVTPAATSGEQAKASQSENKAASADKASESDNAQETAEAEEVSASRAAIATPQADGMATTRVAPAATAPDMMTLLSGLLQWLQQMMQPPPPPPPPPANNAMQLLMGLMTLMMSLFAPTTSTNQNNR